MNIGIDIDDTIAKTFEQIDICAKIYTEKNLKKEFKLHNENEILDPMWIKYLYNWTKEEEIKFFDLYYEKIIEEAEIKEDVAEVINRLSKKHNIILITARWDNKDKVINQITQNWLEKYKINYNKLFLGHVDKTQIAKESKIDIFIDDNFKTCKQISELGIKTLMMDSRLNKNLEDEKIKRVYSWKEIEEYFNKELYSKI